MRSEYPPGGASHRDAGPARTATGLEMLLARGRIELAYLWRHRRRLELDAPGTFTEWVQHRKLHDRDPRMAMLTDKVRVKDWVGERLGCEWVIPTLWQGDRLPVEIAWPLPFVVKSRHGCNQRAFVRTGHEDWPAIRARAGRWTRGRYGRWLDEWAYKDLDRGLLVEPFIGVGDELPVDYKFYVFAGHVAFVQVHLERERNHHWLLLDRDWTRVSAATRDPDPPRPATLGKMIAAAELLGDNFDFVRVDLYAAARGPLFGEMTFYPGSGLDPFNPVALDRIIGSYWKAR